MTKNNNENQPKMKDDQPFEIKNKMDIPYMRERKEEPQKIMK